LHLQFPLLSMLQTPLLPSIAVATLSNKSY
jgi:hypothetical protein